MLLRVRLEALERRWEGDRDALISALVEGAEIEGGQREPGP